MTYWLGRRSFYWGLFVWGVGLVMLGLLLTLQMPVHMQANDRVYSGTAECRTCHRTEVGLHADSVHSLTLIDVQENPEKVLGDFDQENDLLTVNSPDGSRTFSLNDIAYAVGAGEHVQRYLVDSGDNTYSVLPFEWVVESGVWQPFELAGSWPDQAYDWNANCAYCHVTGYELETQNWLEDGVQCEACHGAGDEHIQVVDEIGFTMSEADRAQIRESIEPGTDAQVCGQCHSRGMDSLSDLPFPVNYVAGSNLFDSYTLVSQDDSIHWWQTGHAKQTNMQFNEWTLSAHANAYETLPIESRENPECLECHSEGFRSVQRLIDTSSEVLIDPISESLRLSDGVTCSICHGIHQATENEAFLRAPAEELCADCHTNGQIDDIHHPTVEMFEGQSFIEGIDGVETVHATAEDGPSCVTCHMETLPTGDEVRVSHALSPIIPAESEEGQPDTCTSCHSDLTRTYGHRFIYGEQDDVSLRISSIYSALEANTTAPEWIQDAVAFVEGDGSLGVHNIAYTETLLDRSEQALGLTAQYINMNPLPIADPIDCAECHAEEHREWLASPHANASLQSEFKEAYADNGRPSYCLRCHASGYDPLNQTYAFDGVICTSCHTMEPGVEHPPAPISIGKDVEVCGTCHSGGHASVYEEWLVSEHATVGVDCIDCHTPHDNGLLLEDVNATCGDCHAEAMNDEVHMGESMVCTDCHMTPRQTITDPTMLTQTGHTMHIDPGVCSDCHGNTHMLSFATSDNAETVQIAADVSQNDVERLETLADENLTSGLLGGAVGVLLMLGLVYLVLRLGRAR